MSASVWARTRRQSDLEVFIEDDFFIMGGLSKRNNVDTCGSLRVHGRNQYPTEKTERHKSLFSIFEAVVLEREGSPVKYFRRIDEIETVFFEVSPTLPFVPRKPHQPTVYTLRQYVNWHGFLTLTLDTAPAFAGMMGSHPGGACPVLRHGGRGPV